MRPPIPTPPGHPFRILSPGESGGRARGPLDLELDRDAFGGGTHPTTASCLSLLAALAPLHGLSVVDLGAGTGILALAALRLGAARAICVDPSPEAVACARRNGEANGLADRLAHRLGTAADLRGERFDLVLANVGGEILLDEAGLVAPLARPGGRLLLSGLLAGHGDELAAAYVRRGCRILDRREPAGFVALLLRRE